MLPQPGDIIPDVDVFSHLMIASEHIFVASTLMMELFLKSQPKKTILLRCAIPSHGWAYVKQHSEKCGQSLVSL